MNIDDLKLKSNDDLAKQLEDKKILDKLPSHITCFIDEILNDIKNKLINNDYSIDQNKLENMPKSISRYTDDEFLSEIKQNPDTISIFNDLEEKKIIYHYVCSCWLYENQCKQRLNKIKTSIKDFIQKVIYF